jgi:CRP/FNR family transcriptional regulator, polysaccharide utilization system transcription regulator
MPGNGQELAEMPAMTKESFIRILQEFKSSGLEKMSEKFMEVLDEDTLMSIIKNG